MCVVVLNVFCCVLDVFDVFGVLSVCLLCFYVLNDLLCLFC